MSDSATSDNTGGWREFSEGNGKSSTVAVDTGLFSTIPKNVYFMGIISVLTAYILSRYRWIMSVVVLSGTGFFVHQIYTGGENIFETFSNQTLKSNKSEESIKSNIDKEPETNHPIRVARSTSTEDSSYVLASAANSMDVADANHDAKASIEITDVSGSIVQSSPTVVTPPTKNRSNVDAHVSFVTPVDTPPPADSYNIIRHIRISIRILEKREKIGDNNRHLNKDSSLIFNVVGHGVLGAITSSDGNKGGDHMSGGATAETNLIIPTDTLIATDKFEINVQLKGNKEDTCQCEVTVQCYNEEETFLKSAKVVRRFSSLTAGGDNIEV